MKLTGIITGLVAIALVTAIAFTHRPSKQCDNFLQEQLAACDMTKGASK